jgi:hypothetical protein
MPPTRHPAQPGTADDSSPRPDSSSRPDATPRRKCFVVDDELGIFRLADAKITEPWFTADELGLLPQLDAVDAVLGA